MWQNGVMDGVMDDVGPAVQARRVVRAARAGTLATAENGQPFASLVTPATAPDGSVLFLVSGLSEHTRHLRADGRCSVLVCGPPETANAQTAPRVTVVGTAAREPDPALKARWIALHPYAAFYADLPDFILWRLRPERGGFIGGFARAFKLTGPDLLGDPEAVHSIAAAEARVIEHCNDDHGSALDAIAAGHGWSGEGQSAEGWRMAACDCDGFDLVHTHQVRRIDWPSGTVDGPAAIRAALVHLASAARNRAITSGGRPEPPPV